jgi:hypothetical protein
MFTGKPRIASRSIQSVDTTLWGYRRAARGPLRERLADKNRRAWTEQAALYRCWIYPVLELRTGLLQSF